jgi:hypothetical protein
MIRIKNCDKLLKGTPAEDIAETNGVEGHLVRTQVLKRPHANERTIVQQAVATITAAQLSDGSWSGSVIESCAQIDCLLAYGVSAGSRALRKAQKWLFSQQLTNHPVWTGMFAESRKATNSIKEARGGYGLRALYAKHYRHLTPVPCCASTPVVATCCALEVLFALGEDVSSNPALSTPINRILALGNATNGICGGQSSKFTAETAPIPDSAKLWDCSDNRVFRRPCEENPGTTICAHFLIRAVARSQTLSQSQFIASALKQWGEHQLPNGNFDTKYSLYNFYFAIDTLVLLRQHDAAKEMLVRMLPALLRRQKRDGRWWKKGEWIDTSFSAIWALHSFDLLESAN